MESQREELERALLALDRLAVSRMLSDICAASSPLERVERLIVARVKRDGIRILLLSALMLPAALRIKTLRDRLQAEGCLPRLVVGGAPFRFDDALWREVGADACGRTASEAVRAVTHLVGGAA